MLQVLATENNCRLQSVIDYGKSKMFILANPVCMMENILNGHDYRGGPAYGIQLWNIGTFMNLNTLSVWFPSYLHLLSQQAHNLAWLFLALLMQMKLILLFPSSDTQSLSLRFSMPVRYLTMDINSPLAVQS